MMWLAPPFVTRLRAFNSGVCVVMGVWCASEGLTMYALGFGLLGHGSSSSGLAHGTVYVWVYLGC